MSADVIAAIIAVCGVLVSVIITLIIGFWNQKFNYKQLYAQTVSSNRMDWINVWRENISRFLACAEVLHKHVAPNDELIKIEMDMYESRAMITSRLNLDEKAHVAMLSLINTFRVQTDEDDFITQREAILALAREILKPEWERVKKEAKGKRYV